LADVNTISSKQEEEEEAAAAAATKLGRRRGATSVQGLIPPVWQSRKKKKSL
jgi:hypothetical protein